MDKITFTAIWDNQLKVDLPCQIDYIHNQISISFDQFRKFGSDMYDSSGYIFAFHLCDIK